MNKTLTMNIVETDIEISADGSVKLLSPLPAWLRPGRAHAVMTVTALEDSSANQTADAGRDARNAR